MSYFGHGVGPVIGSLPTVATRNHLDQNVPNPFNPTTTIRYEIKESGLVSLRIYNVAGQLVRTLVDGHRNAGQLYEATWNGLNDGGQPVASGVYFYKLVAKGYVQTKKMVLLK
jgi:flagellar hook assembly protein FlgD